jgi:hypothetical protein
VDASAECLYALADLLGAERVECISASRKSIPWAEIVARPQAPAAAAGREPVMAS